MSLPLETISFRCDGKTKEAMDKLLVTYALFLRNKSDVVNFSICFTYEVLILQQNLDAILRLVKVLQSTTSKEEKLD